MRQTSSCLIFAALTSLLISLSTGTCYFPDGSIQTKVAFQPCNQVVGTISMCCGTNWTGGVVAKDTCQPNGLCLNSYQGEPLFWRGSCTDPTWKSPNCLRNLCTTQKTGGIASDNVAVSQCSDGSWCCGGGGNSTCCDKKLGIVLAATIGQTVTSSSAISSSISRSSTSASTSVSTVLSQTSSSTTQTSTTTPSQARHSSNSVAIGLGCGLGAVVFIALLAGFFLWRRRRSANTPVGSVPELSGYDRPIVELSGHYRPIAELSGCDGPIVELSGHNRPVAGLS